MADHMEITPEDDEFTRRSHAFLAWTSQQGITLSPKIKLADLRHLCMGRAVCSTTDINEDEDLFTIPRAAILTPQTSSLPTEISSELDDPWLALILVLIYEKQQGLKSRWKPCIDVLPTHFDTLMYWDKSELDQLTGSAVLGKIGKEKADTTFTSEIIPIVRRHDDLFDAAALSDQDLLKLCHQMGSTIMAYAFDLEKSDEDNSAEDGWEVASDEDAALPVGMVPMADILNADGDRNNAKLFYEEDRVVMRSIKSITAGSEILNDYGPLPNADLLRRYGYVSPSYTKYDVVEIGQPLVLSMAKSLLDITEADVNERVKHLDGGIAIDAFDIARSASEDGQFPIELLALLRCLAMNKVDFEKLKSKGKMPSDKALTKDEQPVLQMLRAIVLQRRQDYKALEELGKTVQSKAALPGHASREHMALHVISGEHAVLQEAFDTVDQMLNAPSQKRKTSTSNEASSQLDKRQRT